MIYNYDLDVYVVKFVNLEQLDVDMNLLVFIVKISGLFEGIGVVGIYFYIVFEIV